MKKYLGIGVAVLGLAAAVVWWAVFRRGAEPGPFRVGEQLVYRVEQTSAGHSDFGAVTGAAGGARHSVHTSVEGELVLTVLRRDGDTVELLGQVRNAKVLLAGDGAAGLDEARAAGEQLAQPVAIEASAQGHIRRLWAPREWSPATLGLLRGLLAAAQFVWPEDELSIWQIEQQDDNGTAVVAYERKDDTVHRRRERYLPPEVQDEPGEERIIPVAQPEGEVTAVVGAKRRVQRLEGNEATTLLIDKKEVARTDVRVTFELVKAEPVGRQQAEALRQAREEAVRRGQETTLLNRPTDEAVEASIHRTELGKLTLDGYLALLAKADPDDETPLFLKGKALAYLQPSAARRFAELLATAPAGSREAGVLVPVLAGAGTREAQRALAEVVRARKADVAFQLEALPTLGTVRRATPEIDRVLHEIGSGATDRDVRWTAQLAQGALAKALARRAPARSAAIVDVALRDLDRARSPEDKRQALLVLGNTASRRALPGIRRHLAHADAGVRGGAVAALRWHAGEAVEADVCKALAGDAEEQVRLEAANTFEVRAMTPKAIKALCQALAKDASTSVRLGALARLAAIETRGPEVVKALRDAAASDADEEVRKAAAQALEG